MAYTTESLVSLYELGRLYYEMGYYGAAERVFLGLSAVDGGQTPARVGLGLVRIERGAVDDGLQQLRAAARDSGYKVEAKLAMCFGYLSGDTRRVSSLLTDVAGEIESNPRFGVDVRTLYEALLHRVS